MDPAVSYRAGNQESLAEEFIRLHQERQLNFHYKKLGKLYEYFDEDILAVHFADGGAQGDPGAVELLYLSNTGIQLLYGNHTYGDLNLDEVLMKLPMLKPLDSRNRFELPYPFGGHLDIPSGWKYMYMGAMNHFFVREELFDKADTFIKVILDRGRTWLIFRAISWFCGA